MKNLQKEQNSTNLLVWPLICRNIFWTLFYNPDHCAMTAWWGAVWWLLNNNFCFSNHHKISLYSSWWYDANGQTRISILWWRKIWKARYIVILFFKTSKVGIVSSLKKLLLVFVICLLQVVIPINFVIWKKKTGCSMEVEPWQKIQDI